MRTGTNSNEQIMTESRSHSRLSMSELQYFLLLKHNTSYGEQKMAFWNCAGPLKCSETRLGEGLGNSGEADAPYRYTPSGDFIY